MSTSCAMALRPIFALIVAVLASLGMVFVQGPDLVRDVHLRNSAFTPAFNARIDKAKCETTWYIASWCTVSYTLQQPQPNGSQSARPGAADLHYFFFGGTPRERRVMLLSAAHDRNIIVSDHGMSHLRTRIMSFVLFLAA